jgi:hypothetical protein
MTPATQREEDCSVNALTRFAQAASSSKSALVLSIQQLPSQHKTLSKPTLYPLMHHPKWKCMTKSQRLFVAAIASNVASQSSLLLLNGCLLLSAQTAQPLGEMPVRQLLC